MKIIALTDLKTFNIGTREKITASARNAAQTAKP